MDMALACASHTPMLLEEAYSDAATCAKVSDSYDQLARFVRDFAPEQVIQFSPDHYHGFHYDNMPSFCSHPVKAAANVGQAAMAARLGCQFQGSRSSRRVAG
ncbi:hypothetical protein [Sphingobium sp. BS19]|uniref:DODA-type extradiol aromatic ring-opening family dioxygenase n=1 Tax=Sphingobium sp. BS19 TaxID=3018973 RepID=UPI0035CF8855